MTSSSDLVDLKSKIQIFQKKNIHLWPQEKPGRISVFRDSEEAWLKAEISFRNVNKVFIVMFRAGGPATK